MPENKASAAVAIVEIQKPDPYYFIIQRAFNKDDPWSGQLALPGGKLEDEDPHLLHTATRETAEEAGFQLQQHQLHNELPVFEAGSKLGRVVKVAPFHFKLEKEPEIQLDKTEVECSFWVEESLLTNEKNHRLGQVLSSHPHLEMPYVLIENHKLWGFTYKVMMHMLQNQGKIEFELPKGAFD